MKHIILTLLWITVSVTLFGQSNDTWIAFWNKDTTLIGYKDKYNVIKIEPKFIGFSSASKFENIIAVAEEINGEWSSYYLTKAGKKVGKDSLHIFDNGFDCESEGFIRFRDPKTDKTGMFNKNGDIVIPAEYNDLTRVRNGMIIGIKDAKKTYWHEGEDEHSGCNHFSWTEGTEVLMDTLNNILIDNFTYDNNLNLFTLKKADAPSPDSTRISFLAKDGSYYSFIDVEKEFEQWLKNDLFIDLTSEKLIHHSYDTITWEAPTGWKKTDRQKFVTNNFSTLKNGLLEILNPKCDFFISRDGLNPYTYNGEEFEKYYDNCGEAKDWIYPVMNIVVSHASSQNHYAFLRTDDGYKLISVVIRNGKIK